MSTDPLFIIPPSEGQETVTIIFDGRPMAVPAGLTVAAALFIGGVYDFRSSVVGHKPRAPFCMMGVCFECLVNIDGNPARQSCLVQVKDGMQIRRQTGAVELEIAHVEDGL